MNQFIATFFSHFGALRFQKLCAGKGWQSQVRPVPRDLSSSCGTCVYFATDALEATAGKEALQTLLTPELEQIVAVKDGYDVLYEAEEE